MAPGAIRCLGEQGLPGRSDVVVGDDVVQVAVAGVGLAVREHTQRVAESDLFGHPRRRVVPVHPSARAWSTTAATRTLPPAAVCRANQSSIRSTVTDPKFSTVAMPPSRSSVGTWM